MKIGGDSLAFILLGGDELLREGLLRGLGSFKLRDTIPPGKCGDRDNGK